MRLQLSRIQFDQNSFWSAGNQPTQLVFNLDEKLAERHLKALILISNRVLASASFYFESGITRRIARKNSVYLERGDLLFFVNEEYQSIKDHAEQKRRKSPEPLVGNYSGIRVGRFSNELSDAGDTLFRPDVDLSALIRQVWRLDLSAVERGSIFEAVQVYSESESEKARALAVLYSVADDTNLDFVWGTIEPRLVEANLPTQLVFAARRRLSVIYAHCTAGALGCGVDNPDTFLNRSALKVTSLFDTTLFLACLRSLNVLKYFESLGAEEIIELKHSDEWRWFKKLYQALLNELIDDEEDRLGDILADISTAERASFRRGLGHDEFIQIFQETVDLWAKKEKKFESAVAVLRTAHLIFDTSLVDSVRNRVAELADRKVTNLAQPGIHSSRIMTKYQAQSLSSEVNLVKVLFWAANPSDGTQLEIDKEFRDLRRRVRQVPNSEQVIEFVWEGAVERTELQDHLLRERPSILHFSGHGSRAGRIVIEHEAGGSIEMPTCAIGRLFELCSDFVKCVVLNCCYSEEQARIIAQHIPIVIGCSSAVGDQTALTFSYSFYRTIAYGESIDQAFKFAMNQLELLYDSEGAAIYKILKNSR